VHQLHQSVFFSSIVITLLRTTAGLSSKSYGRQERPLNELLLWRSITRISRIKRDIFINVTQSG